MKLSSLLRPLLALMAVVALPLGAWGPVQGAETEQAVSVEVSNVTAKVGEQVDLVARVVPKPGFKIAEAYRNRLSSLSTEDDSVEFDKGLVRGVMKDGQLTFRVKVKPTKSGAHPINGLIRFAFVTSNSDTSAELDIKSAPLMATVTGTE